MFRYTRSVGSAFVIAISAVFPAAAANMSYSYNGPWETPEQNNARSAYYDHLLQVSPGFRAYRMRKECYPIRFDRALRQDCLGTFDQYEPMLYRQ